MEPKEIDQLLESGRYQHLSEATLVSYRDEELDEIRMALANAHLKLCLICDRRLTFLKDEAEAVAGYVITQRDLDAADQTISRLKAKSDEPATPLDALKTFLNKVTEDLRAYFSQEVMLGSEDEDWSYEDRLGTASLKLEDDASLTVHFSSPDVSWAGSRLRFKAGRFSKEAVFRLVEDESSVVAEIHIPREKRPRDMTRNFSLTVVGPS